MEIVVLFVIVAISAVLGFALGVAVGKDGGNR